MTHSLWLHANHQWAFVWIYYLLSKNKCRVNCSMVKSMSPGDSLVICVVYSLIHLLFSTSHLYTYWTTNNNNNDSHIATLWITLSLLDIETMNTSGIDELCLQLCPCPLPGRRWTTKGDRDRERERERERGKKCGKTARGHRVRHLKLKKVAHSITSRLIWRFWLCLLSLKWVLV